MSLVENMNQAIKILHHVGYFLPDKKKNCFTWLVDLSHFKSLQEKRSDKQEELQLRVCYSGLSDRADFAA